MEKEKEIQFFRSNGGGFLIYLIIFLKFFLGSMQTGKIYDIQNNYVTVYWFENDKKLGRV